MARLLVVRLHHPASPVGPHCSLTESHSDQYGPVIVDPSEPDFLGVTASTNNTGEVSAVIWALRWIEAHPLASTHAFEIWSDSYYTVDHTAGLLPTQDWGLLHPMGTFFTVLPTNWRHFSPEGSTSPSAK